MRIRQIILMFFVAVFYGGCFYENACGISNSYWDEKGYYYDAQGQYHETCPDNLIYKDEVLKRQQQEEIW